MEYKIITFICAILLNLSFCKRTILQEIEKSVEGKEESYIDFGKAKNFEWDRVCRIGGQRWGSDINKILNLAENEANNNDLNSDETGTYFLYQGKLVYVETYSFGSKCDSHYYIEKKGYCYLKSETKFKITKSKKLECENSYEYRLTPISP